MSQQEMFPEEQSQGQQPLNNNEIEYPQQPYYWSTRPHTQSMPKDEPAASYDENMNYQEGYQAQDDAMYSSFQSGRTTNQQSRRHSPDGDAFEFGYRPYIQQSVPYWAQAQRHRRNPFGVILLLLVALICIKPLIGLIGILLGVAAVTIGLAIFALLLPLILVFGIMAIVALMVRISGMGRGPRPNSWRRSGPGPWSW